MSEYKNAVKLEGGCYLADREELDIIPVKELNVIPFGKPFDYADEEEDEWEAYCRETYEYESGNLTDAILLIFGILWMVILCVMR